MCSLMVEYHIAGPCARLSWDILAHIRPTVKLTVVALYRSVSLNASWLSSGKRLLSVSRRLT